MSQRDGRTCPKPFGLGMKRMRGITGLKSLRESCKPLIESNNNNDETKDDRALTRASSHSGFTQNSSNTREEPRRRSSEDPIPPQIRPPISLQELAELLGVAPDASTPEGGEQQCVARMIQSHVAQHFPKTPADVDQKLGLHLRDVQDTVLSWLVKLGPLLQSEGLRPLLQSEGLRPLLQSEGLIQCYHQQTFKHLNDLLQDISSSKNAFVLMEWVLCKYLSQDLLGHPDLQDMEPIKKVDLLLFTDWASRAEDILLENVQIDIRRFLAKILQKSQEAHHELYVDTIQCIDAMPTEALKISPELSHHVQKVCFQELLMFLTKYTAEQTDILCKTAKMDKPETKHFFETLKNCEEHKKHVKTKAGDTETSSLKEIMTQAVATLGNMEAFTLKLLMEIVADITNKYLKNYFKSDKREFLFLLHEIKTLFSDLSSYQDELTRVMDEAYKLIAHVYLKRLIKIRVSTLRRRWRPDVEQSVAQDAELLHCIVSELAPGVHQRNRMLLKVRELLDSEDLEVMKMTVVEMHKQCDASREDLELLPALLKWKGLSGRQIREVQGVLEDLPGFQPRPPSWFSSFICYRAASQEDQTQQAETSTSIQM